MPDRGDKSKAADRKDGHRPQPRLAPREDPSFRSASPTGESGQTIIAGMGELPLEIIVDRMMREFGVEPASGRSPGGWLPRGASASVVDVDGKFVRASPVVVSRGTATSCSVWSPTSRAGFGFLDEIRAAVP